MRKFSGKSAKWCLAAALFAGAVSLSADWAEPVQAEQGALVSATQQQTEEWMKAEARRKVAQQNWTTITVIRASLPTLDSVGTCTRRLSNGTTINRNWKVKFTVVGSGRTRQLQAQAPIYN